MIPPIREPKGFEAIPLPVPSSTDTSVFVAGDFRAYALTPGQRGIDAKAPVQLIYVVDVERLTHTAGFQEPGLQDPEVQKSYYFVDTGLIAGNAYVFAAAQGLAAWFHNCDKTGLARQLQILPQSEDPAFPAIPDCLNSPKGANGSWPIVLTSTRPAASLRATRFARSGSA